MKVLNFIIALANSFWIPFVGYKVYGWFSPEVGFELPQLNYLNVFALLTILRFVTNNSSLVFLLGNKPDKEDKLELTALASFVAYSVVLLLNYLFYLILF